MSKFIHLYERYLNRNPMLAYIGTLTNEGVFFTDNDLERIKTIINKTPGCHLTEETLDTFVEQHHWARAKKYTSAEEPDEPGYLIPIPPGRLKLYNKLQKKSPGTVIHYLDKHTKEEKLIEDTPAFDANTERTFTQLEYISEEFPFICKNVYQDLKEVMSINPQHEKRTLLSLLKLPQEDIGKADNHSYKSIMQGKIFLEYYQFPGKKAILTSIF